jgi:hypothetical protein
MFAPPTTRLYRDKENERFWAVLIFTGYYVDIGKMEYNIS